MQNLEKEFKNLNSVFKTRNKDGISLITLIITIVVIIILATISIWFSGDTASSAQKAAFLTEIAEVERLTEIKKQEVYELIDQDFGFKRIRLKNAPQDFVSLSGDATVGCIVDLKYIGINGTKYGKAYKDIDYINDEATFGKTDIYVYDATGTIYYVEGFWDVTTDEYIHKAPAKEDGGKVTFNVPVIESVTFILHESREKAMISIEAYSKTDTDLRVTVDGEVAGYQADNKYYIEKDKNGTFEIVAKDGYGNKSTSTITITGILTHEESIQNPSTLPEIISFISGTQVKRNITLKASAIDVDEGIVAYAFTNKEGIPSQWKTISKTTDAINVSTTIDKSGTWHFWVKNSNNVSNSRSLYVEIVNVLYTIKYDLDGGIWEDGISRDNEKLDDETIEIVRDIPVKAGYSFKGWAISQGSDVVKYKGGDKYSAEDDLNLYAIWIPRDDTRYKVEHYKEDANGEYKLEETQTLEGTTESPVSAASKTYEHYTFNSTHSASVLRGNIIGDGSLVLKVYYARNKYTVSLSGVHGTQSAVGTFKHGTKVQLSAIPDRGYKFSKWMVSAGNVTDLNTSNANTTFTMPTENVAIVAEYMIETYSIDYDLNGGSVSTSNPKTYTVADNFTLNNPTKDGYRFKGWSGTDINGVSKTVNVYNAIGDRSYEANYDELFTLLNTNEKPTYNPIDVKITSIENVRFQYSIDNGSIWKECGSLTASSNAYVTNIKVSENCTVEVRALRADNSVEYTKSIEVSNILKQSEVNAPILKEGMIAVYWDGNVEKTATQFTEAMYDYTSLSSNELTNTSSKWANAKTEDGSYWVWIPRFAYKVEYYTNEARTTLSERITNYERIFVMFMNSTSSTEIKYRNGGTGTLPAGYTVANAFTSNGKELTGIWVSKYEISSPDLKNALGGGNVLTTAAGNIDAMGMRAISNVESWRGISYDNALKNSKFMYEKYDSQLIANKEWEAVAILAQSAYGVNTTKMTLNSSYRTGSGMSTTGNVTGVYDLAGGAWEYVQTDTTSTNLKLTEYLDYIIINNYSAQSIIGQTVRGASSISGNVATNLPVNGGPDSRIGYRVVLHVSE